MYKKVIEYDECLNYDYIFEKTTVRYVLMKDSKKIFMYLLPNEIVDECKNIYKTVKVKENGFCDNRDWFAGSLVHLHIRGSAQRQFANSFKYGESTDSLRFSNQEVYEKSGGVEIVTILQSDFGYTVEHHLIQNNGINAFEVKTVFKNTTEGLLTLEFLTSAVIENLSPFNDEANSENIIYHTFKSGWSVEGTHIARQLSEFGMEKSWGGSFESEKIGTIGSKSTRHYFPYVALEDTKANCIWGIKLKHNATWQAELTRFGTPLSISIGLGDMQFGHWAKNVCAGEAFEAPTAYIACANGGIDAVSDEILKINEADAAAYGEQNMEIVYNDWGLHWGDTNQDKMLSLADRIKDTSAKYFIVDDGWQTGTTGDWEIDYSKFPDGIKSYSEKIIDMGLVPGIWMDYEHVHKTSKNYTALNDDMFLKCNGTTLNEYASTNKKKFLDLRKEEVISHLDDKVIDFLIDNKIGYIKVDHNSNAGLGCDGAESPGEGLRQYTNAAYKFFKRIKEKAPDIIVESCSTGGERLDSLTMSTVAMSSVSDAIDSVDVPIIAANMHYLIPPRQAQVWCVLMDDYDFNRIRYSVSAGFLGRICWSGNIDKLSGAQFAMLLDAERFYKKVCHIIKDGKSTIYRTHETNKRNPKGIQAVVRYSEDKSEALVVYHCFKNSERMDITLDGEFKLADCLYENKCTINGDILQIKDNDFTGNVLLLKK